MVVVTFALALLPGPALRWTNIPAEILGLILNPFALMGNSVSSWLRPPPPNSALSNANAEMLELLHQEAQEFERLYRAEQARVEALQKQLEQLQKIPPEYMKSTVQVVMAGIGLRSPSSPFGLVTLNRGANHGVKSGSIAVYDGVHLMGRVTEDVSAVQCTLLPLVNKSTGTIEARVIPKDRTEIPLSAVAKIGLDPRGDGGFIAQVDKLQVIHEGDQVVLLDSSWPSTAQAMTIGTVASVRTNDMEPLRNTIVVQPAYLISQIAQVVLKIEAEETGPGFNAGRTR